MQFFPAQEANHPHLLSVNNFCLTIENIFGFRDLHLHDLVVNLKPLKGVWTIRVFVTAVKPSIMSRTVVVYILDPLH